MPTGQLVPSCQMGNLGDPTNSANAGADVYSAAPTVGQGPALGTVEILADGTFVQFLKTLANTAVNLACRPSATPVNFTVTPTTAADQFVLAINDRSLTALTTTNAWTWFTTRGICFPKVNAAVAADVPVASSAETGILDTQGANALGARPIVNLVLVGASDAASPCLMA